MKVTDWAIGDVQKAPAPQNAQLRVNKHPVRIDVEFWEKKPAP
jgi:hypothetical protein